jgi:hypothetical protein
MRGVMMRYKAQSIAPLKTAKCKPRTSTIRVDRRVDQLLWVPDKGIIYQCFSKKKIGAGDGI